MGDATFKRCQLFGHFKCTRKLSALGRACMGCPQRLCKMFKRRSDLVWNHFDLSYLQPRAVCLWQCILHCNGETLWCSSRLQNLLIAQMISRRNIFKQNILQFEYVNCQEFASDVLDEAIFLLYFQSWYIKAMLPLNFLLNARARTYYT